MNDTNVEYELVEDVSGKGNPDRTIKTIKVYGTDIKIPYYPTKNCKKCYGRGFIGIANKENVVMCPKCYSPRAIKKYHDNN